MGRLNVEARKGVLQGFPLGRLYILRRYGDDLFDLLLMIQHEVQHVVLAGDGPLAVLRQGWGVEGRRLGDAGQEGSLGQG